MAVKHAAKNSSFKIGIKVLLSLSSEQDSMGWFEAKLTPDLFKGSEQGLYAAFVRHMERYNKLPLLETLFEKFPDLQNVPIGEGTAYYLDLLEERYKYDVINEANVESQTILNDDKTKVDEAYAVMMGAANKIQQRTIGKRVISFTQDAPKIIMSEYHDTSFDKSVMRFHWDYLDFTTKGATGGDCVAIVGRPQAGKSWLMLNNSHQNFIQDAKSSLFVSMEMNHLAMCQRLSTLYTKTPVTGLKTKQYATPLYNRFKESLQRLPNVDNGADIFVVDGNLAADIEDIYLLAQQLRVHAVYIDGAYLCRTKNSRSGRYERITEVAEAMKRHTTSLNIPSFGSWQFNREAVSKKGGRNEQAEAGLENIGMTDAVGQLSSVVLGLMQQKSVETLHSRTIDILKGRDGETGKFKIHWDFIHMNFGEYTEEESNVPLQHI